jgi:hypothetical protein
MGGMQGMAGSAKGRDCGKARDPQRCEAFQSAKSACADKRGDDKRQCMQQSMPPMDCSKSANPDRCAAHQAASDACKDKAGRERRQCMHEHTTRGAK